MTNEDIAFMEVRPKETGWYKVTLFQYNKMEPEHPDYIRDWLCFDGNWDYAGYSGCCYVCFILEKEQYLDNKNE